MKILRVDRVSTNGALCTLDGYLLLGGATKVSAFLGWRNPHSRMVYTAVPGDKLLVTGGGYSRRTGIFLGAVLAYNMSNSPIFVFIRWQGDA